MTEAFELTEHWWLLIVRVTLVYLLLLVLMRLTGKRQLGQLNPMDLLAILLVSETVSPALTGEDSSLTAAAIASATLFGLTLLVAAASYRSRLFERIVEGEAVTLVKDGKLDRSVMASERITDAELAISLRQHSIHRLEDVELGTVEPSGDITYLERKA